MICMECPIVDSTNSEHYDGTGTDYITPCTYMGDLYHEEETYNKNETPEELIFIHDYGFPEIREKQERYFTLRIALMFNIYRKQYISRRMFSKSGFCGRVLKKRKGKKI